MSNAGRLSVSTVTQSGEALKGTTCGRDQSACAGLSFSMPPHVPVVNPKLVNMARDAFYPETAPVPVFESGYRVLQETSANVQKHMLRQHKNSRLDTRFCTPGRPLASILAIVAEPGCSLRLGLCRPFPREEGVYRCRSLALESLLKAMFTQCATLCGASISRYDLHHAHWWHNVTENRWGFLWHALEYPAKQPSFPHELGYCQQGSDVYVGDCDSRDMRRRNVVWIGGDSDLRLANPEVLCIPELEGIWTVDEGLFGSRVADIYYFGNPNARFQDRVLIVPFL